MALTVDTGSCYCCDSQDLYFLSGPHVSTIGSALKHPRIAIFLLNFGRCDNLPNNIFVKTFFTNFFSFSAVQVFRALLSPEVLVRAGRPEPDGGRPLVDLHAGAALLPGRVCRGPQLPQLRPRGGEEVPRGRQDLRGRLRRLRGSLCRWTVAGTVG